MSTIDDLRRDFYQRRELNKRSIYTSECYNNGSCDHEEDDDDADCCCD